MQVRAAGARFRTVAGWIFPRRYSDRNESNPARQRASTHAQAPQFHTVTGACKFAFESRHEVEVFHGQFPSLPKHTSCIRPQACGGKVLGRAAAWGAAEAATLHSGAWSKRMREKSGGYWDASDSRKIDVRRATSVPCRKLCMR